MTADRTNCWEHTQCGHGPDAAGTPCPAATNETCHGANGGTNAGRLCWAVASQQCRTLLREPHTEAPAECAECSFYRRVKYEQGCRFELARPGIGVTDPTELHRLLNNAIALALLSRDVFACMAPSALLNRVMRSACAMTDARSAAAYMPDETAEYLLLKAHCGRLPRPQRVACGASGAVPRSFRLGALCREPVEFDEVEPVGCLAAALPIPGEEGPVGVLELVEPGGDLPADDQWFLWELALAAGLGIANTRLSCSRRQLARRDRARSRSTAMLMHHIVSPLTTVACSLQALRQLHHELGEGEREEMIGHSLKSLATVQGLAGRLLDLESIRGALAAQQAGPVDLLPLVQSELDARSAAAERYRVTFQLRAPENGCPLRVRADEDGLRLIVGNLLDNAVKYSGAGAVQIAVTPRGDHARLTVRDHGPGIPEDEQSQVFEYYRRGSNVADGQHGLGLGLAFVRELVERYGGDVELESVVDVGTAITITLPAAPEAPEEVSSD